MIESLLELQRIAVRPFQQTYPFAHLVLITSSIGTGFFLSLALGPLYIPGSTVKTMSSSCRASSS